MRSGNPVLKGDVFTGDKVYSAEEAMSIQGVVNKTLILLLLAVLSASWIWSNPLALMNYIWPLAIGGLVLAIVTVFKKNWACFTSPLYAVIEGLLLGVISSVLEKVYPGIVIQAVSLTFGTTFCLLLAYKTRLIKATENFKLGVVAATGGIAVVYLIDMALRFFGRNIPFIHESGTFGIVFSVFVVVVAALNLVLDFDFIEEGSRRGAPKYLEWYAAFSLLVTLVWLYLEILRLLSKIRRR